MRTIKIEMTGNGQFVIYYLNEVGRLVGLEIEESMRRPSHDWQVVLSQFHHFLADGQLTSGTQV